MSALPFSIPASLAGGVMLGRSIPSTDNRKAWGSDSTGWRSEHLSQLLPEALEGRPVDLQRLGRTGRDGEVLIRRVVELLMERANGGFRVPEPGRRWLFRKDATSFGEWGRLHRIASFVRPDRGASLYIPEGADDEFLEVQARSKVDFSTLVVSLMSQSLFVEDFREKDAKDSAEAWEGWKRNRMPARHGSVHRTGLTCGYTYVMADVDSSGQAIYLPWSPLRTFAWYADDWTDEEPSNIEAWPALVLRVDRPNRCSVYDAFGVWRLALAEDGVRSFEAGFTRQKVIGVLSYTPYPDHYRADPDNPDVTTDEAHPPLVRFAGPSDLLGDPIGEVEPIITTQQRMEETIFSVLMAQTYAAFRQRWATGMVTPTNPDGTPKDVSLIPFQSIITNESPEGSFGDFGTADLNGFVQLMEAHTRIGAALSQAPPQSLLGSMDNVGADGLAAAEMGNQRRAGEYKINYGESWRQLLREGRRLEGASPTEDANAETIWRDTEARSLQSMAQALGVLASQLNVPKEELWSWLPGVNRTTIEAWKKALEKQRQESPFAVVAGDVSAQLGQQKALPPGQPEGVGDSQQSDPPEAA